MRIGAMKILLPAFAGVTCRDSRNWSIVLDPSSVQTTFGPWNLIVLKFSCPGVRLAGNGEKSAALLSYFFLSPFFPLPVPALRTPGTGYNLEHGTFKPYAFFCTNWAIHLDFMTPKGLQITPSDLKKKWRRTQEGRAESGRKEEDWHSIEFLYRQLRSLPRNKTPTPGWNFFNILYIDPDI